MNLIPIHRSMLKRKRRNWPSLSMLKRRNRPCIAGSRPVKPEAIRILTMYGSSLKRRIVSRPKQSQR